MRPVSSERDMTRTLRFSSAALGMVLLAGLAWYQGEGGLTAGQESIMAGTAVSDSGEQQDSDCENAGNSGQAAADPWAAPDQLVKRD
jgi:hypothetical protein